MSEREYTVQSDSSVYHQVKKAVHAISWLMTHLRGQYQQLLGDLFNQKGGKVTL